MSRLAFAALLLVGCAAPTSTSLPVSAPGEKRDGTTIADRVHRPVHKPRHRPTAVSRSQRRRPVSARLLTITQYCYTGSRNAAGKWPTVGTAAANAYPLGTRLHVQGIGDVVVEDRSAPGATDVDIYGGSDPGCESRAVAFGRRQLLVTELAPRGQG